MFITNDKDIENNNYSDNEETYDDAADIPPEGKISAIFDDKDNIDNKLSENTKYNKIQTKSFQHIKKEESYTRVNNTEQRRCELCKYLYVIGNETYAVHAQEPWPKDVKLFQPYEVEQILLPDNANCLAVQAFLKMCNLEFQIESRPNAEFMSPTGKVPFIKCGAFLIAELEGIVAFVGQKGISLTTHLDSEQKADLRAYLALINNVLGSAENYVCWCDRETYREVTKPRNGSVYPWPLNLIQTWSKRSKQIKALKTLGWYEKTLEEVFQEVETCCQALSDRLENNTYFFGDKFTELDALLYGHIYVLLTTYLPAGHNNFSKLVCKFNKLIKLCETIDTQVMGRKTDLTNWLQQSKTELNKVKQDSEEDKSKQNAEESTSNVAIGDFEKESDWFVIDKRDDIGSIGDALPTHN